MFGSVLLMTALMVTPAQAGGLSLTNVRPTFGQLGGTRPDSKFLPGDILCYSFDIEGIVVNDEGQVQYEMGMEIHDANNKLVFESKPSARVNLALLGGGRLPAIAYTTIEDDQAAGTYTLKLTVKDLLAKPNATQTFTKKFEVAKKQFGIVGVSMSVDERGSIPAPTTGVVGQFYFVQFGVVSFDRAVPKPDPKDPKAKPGPAQPNLTFEMTILDAAGKPTFTKPISYKLAAEVKETENLVVMRFPIPFTKAGKYTVRLKAVDTLANKQTTFDLPIAAVESSN
ncbi:hypothetical protein [Limnoglobus roseus]|uniref:Uncharacterized protein n=1 Tax=Limnoglobus roseus TaxID=2598579 RepID=A0A5C1A7N8_9BACT|nr:hypothetical protein [Limnoglobus roseus]QEL14237.1 hypothetical protein PX52LOC_01107 [Limnoglobus roseus]